MKYTLKLNLILICISTSVLGYVKEEINRDPIIIPEALIELHPEAKCLSTSSITTTDMVDLKGSEIGFDTEEEFLVVVHSHNGKPMHGSYLTPLWLTDDKGKPLQYIIHNVFNEGLKNGIETDYVIKNNKYHRSSIQEYKNGIEHGLTIYFNELANPSLIYLTTEGRAAGFELKLDDEMRIVSYGVHE